MDLPDMEIEFECGATAAGVGEMGMALRSHHATCTDQACKDDIEKALLQYGYAPAEN